LKGYNSAIGSFEGTLIPGARKLAELGARGIKDLASPSVIDTAVREVMKRS
jgi:DNA recombination protein RmuC